MIRDVLAILAGIFGSGGFFYALAVGNLWLAAISLIVTAASIAGIVVLRLRRRAPTIRIELPPPVRPVGHVSDSSGSTPGWALNVRLIADGGPIDILELQIHEDGVGQWQIFEVLDANGRPLTGPIRIDGAREVEIKARSPRTYPTHEFRLGNLSLHVRDSTQGEGVFQIVQLPNTRVR